MWIPISIQCLAEDVSMRAQALGKFTFQSLHSFSDDAKKVLLYPIRCIGFDCFPFAPLSDVSCPR